MTTSQVTYRTTLSKFNKSLMNSSNSRFYETTSTQQKNRISVIKKIITISSIKKEVKKVFMKLMQQGPQSFTQQMQQKIQSVAKTILDNDKQKQLSEDLQILISKQCQDFYSMILKLIKTFVISPLQKSYILKIQKELKQDEQLEHQIKQIEDDISQQKKKKLKIYEEQRSGKSMALSTKMNNSVRQAENFQNKLMRANQKLNELTSNNNKLREKINQLRKQKNAMQDIYVKLKKELQKKKENVQKTIKMAGEAYNARNKAQEELKNLKQQAEMKKQQFKQDCEKLNGQIQHDIRFKQFIKSKLVQKQELQKVQEEIKQKQREIELKKQENCRIENQYEKSMMRQKQIKQCFARIRRQIGMGQIGVQNQGQQLLKVFMGLYEKNAIMKNFVEQITKEVKQLEQKIQQKKSLIQKMYMKSSADECDHEKLNADLKRKFEYQERKKNILNDQYQKSVQTIAMVKKYLQDIFQELNMDEQITNKLKNSNINQQNLTEFLASLQRKGLQSISSYGKLVSEQLRAQKGNTWQIQKQVQQLNNIITLQNAHNMNAHSPNYKIPEFPSELLIKVKDQKVRDDDMQRMMSGQEMKKYAIETLQHFQKKISPKQTKISKKFNVAPTLAVKGNKENANNSSSPNILTITTATGGKKK